MCSAWPFDSTDYPEDGVCLDKQGIQTDHMFVKEKFGDKLDSL
jgi:hypothetical protein